MALEKTSTSDRFSLAGRGSRLVAASIVAALGFSTSAAAREVLISDSSPAAEILRNVAAPDNPRGYLNPTVVPHIDEHSDTNMSLPYTAMLPSGRQITYSVDLTKFVAKLRHFKRQWEWQYAAPNSEAEELRKRQISVGKTEDGRTIFLPNYAAFIDRDDPLIKKLAEEITAGIDEPEDQFMALLSFVQQFPFQNDEGFNDARQIDRPSFPQALLLAGAGDCEDRVIALISMALGLPKVRNLGLAIVYTKNYAKREYDILIGVGGREEKYRAQGRGRPQKFDGLYLANTTSPDFLPGEALSGVNSGSIKFVQLVQ